MAIVLMAMPGMEIDMKSGFRIKGTITLSVKRADGSVIKRSISNLVVDWGLTNLAGVLAGVPFPSTLGYIALGNSSTSAALGDTQLGNELLRDAAVVTQLAPPSAASVRFQIAYAAGAVDNTFREAGIFDADTGGNMFNRVVFEDFVVGVADTLTVTWLIELRNT